MAAEKISFSQVLADLDIHLEGGALAPLATDPAPTPAPAPDALALSVQAQNVLTAHRPDNRAPDSQAREKASAHIDAQGNKVAISPSGTALAQPDNVAWETGRTPRRDKAKE